MTTINADALRARAGLISALARELINENQQLSMEARRTLVTIESEAREIQAALI